MEDIEIFKGRFNEIAREMGLFTNAMYMATQNGYSDDGWTQYGMYHDFNSDIVDLKFRLQLVMCQLEFSYMYKNNVIASDHTDLYNPMVETIANFEVAARDFIMMLIQQLSFGPISDLKWQTNSVAVVRESCAKCQGLASYRVPDPELRKIEYICVDCMVGGIHDQCRICGKRQGWVAPETKVCQECSIQIINTIAGHKISLEDYIRDIAKDVFEDLAAQIGREVAESVTAKIMQNIKA
jgi:hypothetical protein